LPATGRSPSEQMAKHGPKYEPDAFESAFSRPLQWVADHVGVFTIFAVTVFVVLVGLVFIFKASSARADRAWGALATVSGPEALIEFAARHAGTPAEPVALHQAGTMFLGRALTRPKDDPERQKDLASAEKALSQLVEGHSGSKIEVYARQALGQVYEELGRYDAAAREFKVAFEISPESYIRPKLEYDIGRVLYLDGQYKEAESYLNRAAWTEETYGRLPPYVDDYAWRQNAKYLLVMLKPGRREVDVLPKAAGDTEADGEAPESDAPEGKALEGEEPEGEGEGAPKAGEGGEAGKAEAPAEKPGADKDAD